MSNKDKAKKIFIKECNISGDISFSHKEMIRSTKQCQSKTVFISQNSYNNLKSILEVPQNNQK